MYIFPHQTHLKIFCNLINFCINNDQDDKDFEGDLEHQNISNLYHLQVDTACSSIMRNVFFTLKTRRKKYNAEIGKDMY